MKTIALINYTLRELSSKAVLYVLAGISTLIIVGTLIGLSAQSSEAGTTLLMFGNAMTPPFPDDQFMQITQQMQSSLAKGLFAGVILFGVFATAGIVPEMMDKGLIDLYLSKPLARWNLLAGKSLGAVVAILINILYFIGAVWLIYGLKLGAWNLQLLLASLSLTFVFACLFSIVSLIGVLSRNTAIAIIGAFLYLVIIGNLLEGREHGLYLISENSVYRTVIDGAYYLLPQLSAMQDSIGKQILHEPMEWKPFAQSLLSATALFGVGAYVLKNRDY